MLQLQQQQQSQNKTRYSRTTTTTTDDGVEATSSSIGGQMLHLIRVESTLVYVEDHM